MALVILIHRLAWFYVHGEWPKDQIDHINGIRTDNRIANLRDVSPLKNQQNQRNAHSRNKSSGMLGVTWHNRNKRWQAQIAVGGKYLYLGGYSTPEEASAAYLTAKRQMHEGCTI